MGRLFIPAEQKLNGPWLLSLEALKKLDVVIERISTKLEFAINEDYKASPEKYYNKKPDFLKKVLFTDKKKSTLSDSSLVGILQDQRLSVFKPKELTIELGKSYSDFSVRIFVSHEFRQQFEYEVICDNVRIKEQVKYEIDNWVEEYKPDKASQIWSSFVFNYLIYFLGAIWVLSLLGMVVESPDDIEGKLRKKEVYKIINQGIDSTNIYEAIELILKDQVDYTTPNTTIESKVNKPALKVLMISLVCLILLSIHPRTTIGVGKNSKTIKFYLFWKKFILITIPATIIVPIVLSFLKEILK